MEGVGRLMVVLFASLVSRLFGQRWFCWRRWLRRRRGFAGVVVLCFGGVLVLPGGVVVLVFVVCSFVAVVCRSIAAVCA